LGQTEDELECSKHVDALHNIYLFVTIMFLTVKKMLLVKKRVCFGKHSAFCITQTY